MSNIKLEALLSTKEQLLFQLQCFEKTLTEGSILSVNLDAIEARCHSLRNFIEQIFRVFHEIKSIDPQLFDVSELTQIETSYYDSIGKANAILRTRTESSGNLSIQSSSSSGPAVTADLIKASGFKLPDLKPFNGQYSEWTAFKQMYDSLVHNNTSIPTILKFHHLKTSLGDKPKWLIQNLDFTEANYEIALKILKERYEDRHLTIAKQVETLLNMRSSTVGIYNPSRKLTAQDFESMYNCINQTMQALNALEVNTDSWDPIICHLVVSQLDDSALAAWGNKIEPKTTPTKEQILMFLDKRRRVLETVENAMSEEAPLKRTESRFRPQREFVSRNQLKRKLPPVHGLMQIKKFRKKQCAYCSGDHYISSCFSFRRLTMPDKWTVVRTENLCRQCLRPRHPKGDSCPGYPCKKCGKDHHGVLHDDNTESEKNTHNPHLPAAKIKNPDIGQSNGDI